jgi:hypothetical protein
VSGVCEVEILASPDGDQMSVEDAAGSDDDDQTAAAGESPSAESSGGDETAATDGGDEDGEEKDGDTESPTVDDETAELRLKGRIMQHIRKRDKGEQLSVPGVAASVSESPDAVQQTLDNIASERSVIEETDDGYRVL